MELPLDLPLARLRVLDLTEADAQYCGRYLADLGARVILVEPPGGSAGRRDPAVSGCEREQVQRAARPGGRGRAS